jgi:hypothetical protein
MDKKIDCSKARTLMSEYLSGNLDRDTFNRIEKHLESCQACREVFDEEENRMFLRGRDKGRTYNAKDIESRFTKRIAGKVLSITLFAITAVYLVFGMLMPVIMGKALMNKSEKIRYALTDLARFTMPGVSAADFETHTGLFNITTVVEYEEKLIDGVGERGTLDLAVPIYMGSSDMKIKKPDKKTDNNYFFSPKIRNVQKLMDKLKPMKNFTKVQYAVSLKEPVSITDMGEMIEAADPEGRYSRYYWFSLDTGDLFKEGQNFIVDNFYSVLGLHNVQWGFPMNIKLNEITKPEKIYNSEGEVIYEIDIEENENSKYTSQGGMVSVEVAELIFKREFKVFEKYCRYFDDPKFIEDVKAINKNIEENGVMINGVIMVSETEDLLKVGEFDNITAIEVIEMDFDY